MIIRETLRHCSMDPVFLRVLSLNVRLDAEENSPRGRRESEIRGSAPNRTMVVAFDVLDCCFE